MAHEVKMPQLGESVHEGQIGKWLKQVGDAVERYEPLLEVITDKVDTEVTAVESGTLLRILVDEGRTVQVGTTLALIGEAGEALPDAPAVDGTAVAADAASKAPAAPSATQLAASTAPAAADEAAPADAAPRVSPVAARVAAEHGVDLSAVAGTGPGGQVRREDVERHVAARGAAPAGGTVVPAADTAAAAADGPADGGQDMRAFLSPRVSRLAMELGVDLRQVKGTGQGGRITARDVERFAAAPPATVPAAVESAAAAPGVTAGPGAASQRVAAPVASGMLGEIVELTPMRKAIAEHMVRSKATSPHVSTVHEVDMSAVMAARQALKPSYAERGVNLTFTAFLCHAVAQTLVEFPMLNSSWTDAGIQVHRDINLGLAVAVPQGLIVPVVRNADQRNLLGMAQAINDLTERARNKKLVPDDVQGGTFTLTNYGTLGSLFGTPVINQPQAAILGTGAIVKRVVVLEGPGGDSIGIRPMMFLSLTFDHRILDGGSADPFMQRLVERLQTYQA